MSDVEKQAQDISRIKIAIGNCTRDFKNLTNVRESVLEILGISVKL